MRGQKIPDGGPPVGQRRQDRDDMFIQIDGSAEKQGTLMSLALKTAMQPCAGCLASVNLVIVTTFLQLP